MGLPQIRSAVAQISTALLPLKSVALAKTIIMTSIKYFFLLAILLFAQICNGTIVGTTCIKPGEKYTYILQVPGATSPFWTFTGAGSIGTGQSTNTIEIFSNNGPCTGVLKVSYYDATNTYQEESITVTRIDPYFTMSPNLNFIYFGEPFTATVNVNHPCGTSSNCSYFWRMPSCPGCITSSNTIATPTFVPPPISANGGFQVYCDVTCGTGCTATVGMTLFTKLRPINLSASGQAYCSSTAPITFSVNQVAGATSYEWIIPQGWLGSSTMNTITVTPNGTKAGYVTATARNQEVLSIAQMYMSLTDKSRHNLIALPNSRILYVGTDLKLHLRYWDGIQWVYQAITPANGGWGNIQVEGWLAAEASGNRIFFKTTTGKLYSIISVNNLWRMIPIPTTVDVKSNIALRSDGVFYIGSDNLIYRAYQSNGSWLSEAITPTAGWQNIQVAGSLALDEAGHIFFRSTDNRMFNLWGGYTTPQLNEVVGGCSGEIAVNGNNVYFKATDNKIHYVSWNGSWWQESIFGQNNGYAVDGFMAFDNNRIFYKGSDGKAHVIAPVSGINYLDLPLDNNVTNIAGDLVFMDGKLFYISKDNKVHNFQWSGTFWWDSDFPLANAKACSDQYNSFMNKPAGTGEEGGETELENGGLPVQALSTPASNISVYPNPNRGLFTLRAENIAATPVEVYDITGKKIEPTLHTRDNATLDVDLTHYPKGLYMIRVTLQDKQWSQKIMVQ